MEVYYKALLVLFLEVPGELYNAPKEKWSRKGLINCDKLGHKAYELGTKAYKQVVRELVMVSGFHLGVIYTAREESLIDHTFLMIEWVRLFWDTFSQAYCIPRHYLWSLDHLSYDNVIDSVTFLPDYACNTRYCLWTFYHLCYSHFIPSITFFLIILVTPDIVGEDGQINRRALGGKVFADKSRLEVLNQIVWPEIARMAKEQIQEVAAQGKSV